jgi:hypothetical protein
LQAAELPLACSLELPALARLLVALLVGGGSELAHAALARAVKAVLAQLAAAAAQRQRDINIRVAQLLALRDVGGGARDDAAVGLLVNGLLEQRDVGRARVVERRLRRRGKGKGWR